MAVSSPQIREVRGWRAQACAYCGCAYRVLLRETTDDDDPATAMASAQRSMCGRILDAPCPACSCYQPDLIASRLKRWHLVVLLVAVVAFATVLVLTEIRTLPIIAAQVLLAAIGLAALLLHAGISWIDPNRNREAGIAAASRLLGEGSLQMLPGDTSTIPAGTVLPRVGGLGWFMVFLMLVGAMGTLLAEGVRLARGWPINVGWDPIVAGAGDSARVTFTQSITSVQGWWKATAKARISNAAELGLASDALLVETQSDPWSRTIHARTSQKNVRDQLWVRVHLPRTMNCSGQKLKLNIAMWVCYPSASSRNPKRFSDHFRTFDLQAELYCADPEAGRIYEVCWRGGSTLGGAMILLGGCYFMLRSHRLAKLARPGPLELLPLEAAPAASAGGERTA